MSFCQYSATGTPAYVAPEVADDGVGGTVKMQQGLLKATDMYSIGKTQLHLLVGCHPLQNVVALKKAVDLTNMCTCSSQRTLRKPADLSQDAKVMIRTLTDGDPSRRPKATDALKFPYLSQRP